MRYSSYEKKKKGYHEPRGKQQFKRSIAERILDYPEFHTEFGHLEGDTIVGSHHRSAVITLVERLSKVIVILKPEGRKSDDIEKFISGWFKEFPKKLFKSITFDCGNF